MAERKAAALAGTAVSAMSAAVAIGANFGLFGLATQPEPRIGTFIPASLSRQAGEAEPEHAGSEPGAEPHDETQPTPQLASAAPVPVLDDGPGRAAMAPPRVTPAAPQAPQAQQATQPPPPAHQAATTPAQADNAQVDQGSSNSGQGSAEHAPTDSHTDDGAEDHGNDDHRSGDDD
jgi:hypothetical protein